MGIIVRYFRCFYVYFFMVIIFCIYVYIVMSDYLCVFIPKKKFYIVLMCMYLFLFCFL